MVKRRRVIIPSIGNVQDLELRPEISVNTDEVCVSEGTDVTRKLTVNFFQ